MKIALSIVLAISACLSLFMSIGRLLARERRFENYSLGILLFCIALFQAQGALYVRNYLFEYPALFFLHLTIMYLAGVLLYFVLYAAALPGEKTPRVKFLYFIPSVLALACDLFYLVQPETNKILILSNFFSGGFLVFDVLITALVAGAGIQATLLTAVLLGRIHKRIKAGKKPPRPGLLVASVIIAAVMMDLLVAGYLVKLPVALPAVSLVLAFVIIGACTGAVWRRERRVDAAAGRPGL